MTRSTRRPDVCLVSMPLVALERPSLSLGILKAAGERDGLTVRCLNPAFAFAERLGLDLYYRLADGPPNLSFGDWLFAGAAFPEAISDQAGYLDQIDPRVLASWLRIPDHDLRASLQSLREEAARFVRETAEAVLDTGATIVGCSSVFQQQAASLALLRQVKKTNPSGVTMLGGANTDSEMGVAAHRAFPWLDFVVSGEADLLFGPLCLTILETPRRALSECAFPVGVLGPGDRERPERLAGPAPRARVDRMDDCPVPDFTEYFEDLARSRVADRIRPSLPVETSRGCWWGQKHHCTFCGLNGGSMIFRAKSPERVLSELADVTTRFGITRVHVVDNIIDLGHVKTVIPALARAGAPYSMFYETKANLREEQMELLADAGVIRIQPGIESLHAEVLRLMDKGTTPVINLQLLKRARRLGIFVAWNMLWEFPGERLVWYDEVADWLPLVFHLQAPNMLASIRYDRFSPYHQHPEAYGLSLEPSSVLRHVYPVDDATLRELSYYFDDKSRPLERLLRSMEPTARRFSAVVREWMAAWGQIRAGEPSAAPPPRLEKVVLEHEAIEILDTRPVALEPRTIIRGLEARVLTACDRAPSSATLARELDVPAAELDRALAKLRERRLLLELDGQILALPTAPARADYFAPPDSPAGYVQKCKQNARRPFPPALVRDVQPAGKASRGILSRSANSAEPARVSE